MSVRGQELVIHKKSMLLCAMQEAYIREMMTFKAVYLSKEDKAAAFDCELLHRQGEAFGQILNMDYTKLVSDFMNFYEEKEQVLKDAK